MWFDCIDAELWPLLTKTSLGVSTFPDHFANVTTRERDMDREGLASCLALEVWVKGCVKPTSHQSTSSAHKKCWLPWSDRSLRLEIFRRVPNDMKVVWRNVMNRFMTLAICLATATDPRTTGGVNQAQFGWNRLCIGLTTLYLAMCTKLLSRWWKLLVQELGDFLESWEW